MVFQPNPDRLALQATCDRKALERSSVLAEWEPVDLTGASPCDWVAAACETMITYTIREPCSHMDGGQRQTIQHVGNIGLRLFPVLQTVTLSLQRAVLPEQHFCVNMSFRGRPYRGVDRGGRGGGGGSWWGPRPNRVEQLPPDLPLGPTVDNININTLFTEEDSPTITDVKYVASYNWLDGKSPVVLVPG